MKKKGFLKKFKAAQISPRRKARIDKRREKFFEGKIDLDEKRYSKASMQLTARDRMREIKLWSMYKKKYDDGSFDTKDVNTHQLESYHLTMKNKAETLTTGSSQPEVFNVLGQLQSIERIKKDHEQIEATKQPEQLSGLGAKSE